MINNEQGKHLHDKATTGRSLSPKEQEQLNSWYAIQDAQEEAILKIEPTREQPEVLYQKIEKALEQLTALANRLQQLTAENQILRKKNEALSLQVAHLFH